MQKFHPISETVTKDVYNNANAGSRFDGRDNGGKQSSGSSCSPNSRNILSPNQFWRAVRIFFSIAIVCSTEIRMWTTSVRQRSLHKRGTLFQARTPLTLVLSPRITGDARKSAKLASTPELTISEHYDFRKRRLSESIRRIIVRPR